MLSLLFFIFFVAPLTGQVSFGKIREDYQDGEDFYQEGDYKEALYYFLQVEKKGYLNANLRFKIGMCYLNIPGEETKAIPYLEEASRHISSKYKGKGIDEKQAPLHSLFYLGNAYRINNELAKALAVYEKFTKHKAFGSSYNNSIVENEISACERAKVIQDAPIEMKLRNMGAEINSSSSETNPVISGDGDVLVYLTALKFYNAIYYTRKVDGYWGKPENINPQVVSDGEFYPTALSFDGKELYLVKKSPKNSDIYISIFEDGKWGQAQPMNKNINSGSDETGAAISADGKRFYFVSNRGGGRGGFDIYVCRRLPDGQWGKAENMGKIVNSKEDEATPSISADGNVLFFSSKGHFNMGGFDIFFTEMQQDGTWGIPNNYGYPLNNTGDNFGFQTTGEGLGYIARIKPDGLGKEDIYQVTTHGKFILRPGVEK